MGLPNYHLPKRLRQDVMMLSRPGRHRHRRHLPCSHPEDQPRPVAERHPQEAHAVPLRARPYLPHAEQAARRCPEAPPASPLQEALALQAGAGALPRALELLADGPEHRALLADAYGAAGNRGYAEPLARRSPSAGGRACLASHSRVGRIVLATGRWPAYRDPPRWGGYA